MWTIIIKLVSTSESVSSLNLTKFMITTISLVYIFLASHIIRFLSTAIWSLLYRRTLWTKIDFFLSMIDVHWPSRKFKWQIHDVDRTFPWFTHNNCIAWFLLYIRIIVVIQHSVYTDWKLLVIGSHIHLIQPCNIKWVFLCLVDLKTTFRVMSIGQ